MRRRPAQPQPNLATTTEPETSISADWRTDEVKRLQLRALCSKLMGRGITKDRIPEMLRAHAPDITDREAFAMYWGVMTQWRDDYSRETTYHRSTQLQRLTNDLVRMRSAPKPPWGAIGRHEEIIARITGTFAEQRVTIVDAPSQIKEALVGVIAGMSDDEMQEFLEAEGVEVVDSGT